MDTDDDHTNEDEVEAYNSTLLGDLQAPASLDWR